MTLPSESFLLSANFEPQAALDRALPFSSFVIDVNSDAFRALLLLLSTNFYRSIIAGIVHKNFLLFLDVFLFSLAEEIASR